MDFIAFARVHGVEINPGKLYAASKIKRCGTVDKPKSTNGAYFFDGQRGWVWNWAGEARVQWWNDTDARPWTEQEKAAWRAQRAAAQQAQEQSYAQAARRAQEMLREARPSEHAYLARKGFAQAIAPVLNDVLLVPMRNVVTNAVQGVQQIAWDETARKFDKKMLAGMRAKGAVFRMGPPRACETFLCEGYATGLSVHAALRGMGLAAAVLVCFSAHNLAVVASQVSGRRFVCADNDASQTGQQAAEATGLPWCMPDAVGMDFNDLHAQCGLLAVGQKLMAVRRQEAVMT